jgi:S-adenosyl-L-methionine hydrolase (adenosine-forming)
VPQARPLITLLTDFGDRGYFVASMKGVILTIDPQATIVDLSHHIAPHAVDEAGYVLKSCYRHFPAGTVHVAVVDPGVGTARRPLVVKGGGYYFLAPDNGLLSYVFDEERDVEVRMIENPQYRLESPGRTFDGRDLFAPAAAWLSKQQPITSFGNTVGAYQTFPISKPKWESRVLVGEIVFVDRFGNLISNLTTAHLREVREVTKRPNPLIRIGNCIIEGLMNNYSEGHAEAPHALINSNGQLEIFVKEADASGLLGIGKKASVRLS